MASNSAGIGGLLPPVVTADSGKILTTDGQLASWEVSSSALPSQGGNNGKFLTTDGTTASWASVSAGVTIGAFGSTPTANAMTASGSTITGQPADATHPGFLTIAAQTFTGIKTFADGIQLPVGKAISAGIYAIITPFSNDLYIGPPGGGHLYFTPDGATVYYDFAGNGNFFNVFGNVEVQTVGASFVLKSPDGTRWKLAVANTTGALTAVLA